MLQPTTDDGNNQTTLKLQTNKPDNLFDVHRHEKQGWLMMIEQVFQMLNEISVNNKQVVTYKLTES
jgi:ferritin-like metal-binding protein YciE